MYKSTAQNLAVIAENSQVADNRPYTQPDFSAVDTCVQIVAEIFLAIYRILQ